MAHILPDEDTTLGDALKATGITGEYDSDGKDGEIPCFRFERGGYSYNIEFLSLEEEGAYETWTEEGIDRIEEMLRNEKLKNNQVIVFVSPLAKCKNISVYEGVVIYYMSGERAESCTVPSGEEWTEVIQLIDSKSMMWYVFDGTNRVEFEFQAEPLDSGKNTITVSAGTETKSQEIKEGTNKFTFSWEEPWSTLDITIDGPEKLYIRNAVLNP